MEKLRAALQPAPTASEAEEEEAPEPGTVAFRGQPAVRPPLSEADAQEVMELARSQVPMQAPMAAAAQEQVAIGQALLWLEKWSTGEGSRPDRWQPIIQGAIQDAILGPHDQLYRPQY